MIDLIVFSIGENRYAMNIENVQRIIQAEILTEIPNSHPFIDGMMSYEKRVIKVLNFRKLIGMQRYENELSLLFEKLKDGHKEWIDALGVSLESGVAFTKTLDSSACELGKWIDSFTAYDDDVVDILNRLIEYHKQLHLSGATTLEMAKKDRKKALKVFYSKVTEIYRHTMGTLDTFIKELDLVAASLQKMIIYENSGVLFAIKVDAIEDIAHVQESEFKDLSGEYELEDLLELEGVLELKDVLINIIKTVKLPS